MLVVFLFIPQKVFHVWRWWGNNTNDKKIYEILKSIRVHGKSEKNGNFDRIGLTGRQIIQATVCWKIEKFRSEQKLRIELQKFI